MIYSNSLSRAQANIPPVPSGSPASDLIPAYLFALLPIAEHHRRFAKDGFTCRQLGGGREERAANSDKA